MSALSRLLLGRKSDPLPPRVGRARARTAPGPSCRVCASRARLAWRVRALPQCTRAAACPGARGVRAVSPGGAVCSPPPFSLRLSPPASAPFCLPPLQTPAGRSGGTRAPRGRPRRSAARGRTLTATAASRRARCVPGAAARRWALASAPARAALHRRCLDSCAPASSPPQDARFYAGVVPLSEPFECVCWRRALAAAPYGSARVAATLLRPSPFRAPFLSAQQQGQGPDHRLHGQAHAGPRLRRLVPQAAAQGAPRRD